jgi:hypothetical protein
VPSIQFDYRGQTYNADVTDNFLQLTDDEQKKKLVAGLGTDPTVERKKEEGGFLHYLSMLNRPAQAFWGGVKETKLGGDIHEALGGIDTTPNEGFLTGAKRGWMGEEEIRTQDFLDPSLPGWYRGIWGFVGDVLMDPLTYAGGAIGSTLYRAGRGIRAATPPQAARWLQTIKDNDIVQDISRNLNIPLGQSKKVKGVARLSAEQKNRIEKELSQELPKLHKWMEDKARTSGQSVEVVRSAFRNWMDRPAMHSKKSPTGWRKKHEDELRKRLSKVIGDDGIREANAWEGKLTQFLKEEQAAGIFVHGLIMRHYFPRFTTPAGREAIDKGKLAEEFIPSGPGDIEDPLLFFGKEPYRHPRTWEGTLDEQNMMKVERLGGTATRNPADIPYENTFFHTDPTIAIGQRYVDHAASMQKKWFIDEITDSGRAFNTAKGTKEIKPFIGVGRWMRRNPDDPAIVEQRILNEAGEFEWKPITEDMSEWVSVKGVPDKYLDEKAILKEAEEIEQAAYGNAIAVDKMLPKDALRVAREKRRAFLIEKGKISMVFKAPKQVAKQIEQELEMMGAINLGNKEIQKFIKYFDAIQNPWKAWTLAVRPAYHTRNAIGNIFNAYIVTGLGSNLPKAVETFADAAKLQYYARFEGRELLRRGMHDRLTKTGKPIRGKGLKTMPKIDDAEWVADDFAGTGYSMNQISNEGLDRGINAGHYRKDVVRDEMENIEYMQGRGKYQKAQRIIGMENPAIKFGFAVGGTIEGNARYAIFLNTLRRIKQGDDLAWVAPDGRKVMLSEFGKGDNVFWTTEMKELPGGKFSQVRRLMTKDDAAFDVAANQVKEALFDYSDLSKFERNWMKRVMPFYTWTRKNFPVQFKHLILNPQRAEKLNLAKEQFEYDSGDLTLSSLGAFWGKRAPVFLGGEKKGVVKAFTLLNTIPLAEFQRLWHPKQLLLEMTTPFPKEIFEQLNNYDTFRESEITEFENQSKDLFGVALPVKLWKLSQLLVPLVELNRWNPAGVFGEQTVDPETGQQMTTKGWGGWGAYREGNPADISEAARWVRFFSGARVYDINLQKQIYFANKNVTGDLGRLKTKLKWAQARGENRRTRQLLRAIAAIERQGYTEGTL